MITSKAALGCLTLTNYFSKGKEISIRNRYRKLSKFETDKTLVYNYMKDYEQGLTACELIKKMGLREHQNSFLRIRPRLTDLKNEGLLITEGAICRECGRKETRYLIVRGV